MVQVARGKALVAKLRANPDVRDAEALAAYLGRKKKLREAAKKAKKVVKKASKSIDPPRGPTHVITPHKDRKDPLQFEKSLDSHDEMKQKLDRMGALGNPGVAVEDANNREVLEDARQLHRLPDHLLDRIGENEKNVSRAMILPQSPVVLGTGAVPDVDHNGDLKGESTGFDDRSWDDVGGIYRPDRKQASTGTTEGGSVSISLHELGHYIGDNLRDSQGRKYNDSPVLEQVHTELWDHYDPYIQQEKPGDHRGRRELLAEAFAHTVVDPDEARNRYGDILIEWIQDQLLKG